MKGCHATKASLKDEPNNKEYIVVPSRWNFKLLSQKLISRLGIISRLIRRLLM